MTFAHSESPRWITSDQIAAAVSVERARVLLEEALKSGFQPSQDPARVNIPVHDAGHVLLMPSVLSDWTGTKIATVAPDNPSKGAPRIQAIYLLMDAETLSPQALMEGNALTTLRTPAVSAVAVDYLAPRTPIERMVLFGTGPQALSHIQAMTEVREIHELVVCGREEDKIVETVEAGLAAGIPISRAGSPEDVSGADLIVCCTSSSTPLFDGTLVPENAVVVAMGSHEPEARELDSALLSRAQVVVEDHATAMREAGDVIQPIKEGVLDEDSLVELVDLVNGSATADPTRPRVFKCVGMSWEDLAVAVGVMD
ncbi:ornithine cyclodeaminase [Corynebacterium atrinae]|uniref:ornithine cyclodeaminase family protein n=1 Tax=Corynebacterium atrinae TaxID=1336740 RepID=UPI0025B6136F|nr:ornithine cyclodeaminase family protein [Corynebacterium atrinae]WJY63215.1 ornithine cyclodeaminase [Corynebacterium atrinae]